MDASCRRSWPIVVGSLLALASGCGEPGGTRPGGEEQVAAALETPSAVARFGDRPRLFARQDADRELRLYLPQGDDEAVLVDVACASSEQVRSLFGIAKVELVDLLSDDDYLALLDLRDDSWSFECSPDAPSLVQYVDGTETWLVQLPGEVLPGTADGEVKRGSDAVLAIPKRCSRLLEHFQVASRAREQRGQAPAPALTPSVHLSCSAPPVGPSAGLWSADVVLTGIDQRPLIVVSSGEARVYLHRVDGLTLGRPEQNQAALARAGALFRIPPERQTATLLPERTPAIALDVCAQQCAGFVPTHLVANESQTQLVCPGGAAPGPNGACARRPSFVLTERVGAGAARVLMLTRDDLPAEVLHTFAVCEPSAQADTPDNPSAETWERALGLRIERGALDLVETARATYLQPPESVVTPCVRDTGCTVQIAPNADISEPAVLRAIGSSCWRGERSLTLRLAGSATARGTLTLTPPARCPGGQTTSELPCSIRTVRLVGAGEGAEVIAAPRACGATPCRSETPAIVARGGLTLEIEGVRLTGGKTVAGAGSSAAQAAPVLPGNRVGVEARDGATLVLRRAEIGASELDTPVSGHFYTGVRATDATVYAFQTSVRAYSTGIDARRSRVVMVGTQSSDHVELRALPGTRTYAELLNLAGSPMAQATNFIGLRLEGSGTRAFLGKVSVTAPVGLLYLGPGSGKADVAAVDTLIGWNPRCTARVFAVESRALELAGTGELRFSSADVAGVGTLLRCHPLVHASAVFEGYSTFDGIQQRLDPGSCRVTTELPIAPEACTL